MRENDHSCNFGWGFQEKDMLTISHLLPHSPLYN